MSDLFDVSKEVILVTGASQGLGRQFARVLSAHGAAVALAAARPRSCKVSRMKSARGGRAAAVPMDVTDIASIGAAIDRAETALGPISVLVNNAGIAVEKLAVDQTEADWDAVVNANLKGAYFAATEMARRMIVRKQGGNIVNIASVLGFGVMKFLSPYTISKAGIVQATRAMALELAGNHIRVNALAPGYIDTEMNHAFWATPAGEIRGRRPLLPDCAALHPGYGGRVSPRSSAHFRADHVGGLLADHDGRRIGVAADQSRHDRGVDHAQAVEAVDPEPGDRASPPGDR